MRAALIASLSGVVLVSVVVIIWELVSAVPFLGRAPLDFWGLAALAILVDAPTFIPQNDRVRIRTTVSVCLCFAIFFLWGPAPAIVVQAIAAAVSAIGQRYWPAGSVFFVSRLVIALAVAAVVSKYTAPSPAVLTQGAAITGRDILWFLELTAIWLAVSQFMILAFWWMLHPARIRAEAPQFRTYMTVTATALLMVTPLLITLPAGWNLIIGIPLLAWNIAIREGVKREQLLRKDPLTGLQNHRGMIAYAENYTLQDRVRVQPFGVALIRAAEHVPGISSSMGRHIYEGILVEFARRLQVRFGEYRVGRLPGEGMVVMLSDPAGDDPVAAAAAAAAIMSEPMIVNGIPFRFHCSAGVTVSPEHGRDLDSLLLRSEYALTQALRTASRVAAYVPQTGVDTQRQVDLLAEAHAALQDPGRSGEFTMAYQPQVDIDTGTLQGVEALIRWTHPRWGPVSPDELIAAIEPSDVMHELTRRVVAMVTSTMADWNRRGFSVPVSINVSVQDLREPTFADEVASSAHAGGIEPSKLTIEITERMMMTSSVVVEQAAAHLTELGFGLSIDDFGTGHASMQQIRLLPLNEIKIDRSFTSGLLTNPSERAIVTSVHQLAGALGVKVVAEGIENAETAAALRVLGGVVGQGWHFGRPMSGEALFKKWNLPNSPGLP